MSVLFKLETKFFSIKSMIILSIIKAMTDGSSEKHVKYILNHIDKNIWESITDKAISKMPKYKIAI